MVKILFSSALVFLLVGRAAPIALHSKPFQYSERYGFYGTAVVEGYVKLEEREGYGNVLLNHAVFVIQEAKNEAVYELVPTLEITLGCYDGEKVYSDAFADDGHYTNEISGVDLATLLQSSQEDPVLLKLTKPVYTRGKGIEGNCLSSFRDFKISHQ